MTQSFSPTLRAIHASHASIEDCPQVNDQVSLSARNIFKGSPAGYRDPDEKQVAFFDYVGEVVKHRAVALADAINAGRDDDSVSEGLLYLSSPGGSVSGVGELAEAVYHFAQKKTMTCYCDDLCCSAAYWIGSQATRMYCNETALIGSIGTYVVVLDASTAFENAGLKVIVVRSGQAKGSLQHGAGISQEDLDRLQVRVDAVTKIFVSAVARGRNLTVGQVSALATGEIWTGSTAKDVGLVDEVVASFEDVLSTIAERTSRATGNVAGILAQARALNAASVAGHLAKCRADDQERARKVEAERQERIRSANISQHCRELASRRR